MENRFQRQSAGLKGNPAQQYEEFLNIFEKLDKVLLDFTFLNLESVTKNKAKYDKLNTFIEYLMNFQKVYKIFLELQNLWLVLKQERISFSSLISQQSIDFENEREYVRNLNSKIKELEGSKNIILENLSSSRIDEFLQTFGSYEDFMKSLIVETEVNVKNIKPEKEKTQKSFDTRDFLNLETKKENPNLTTKNQELGLQNFGIMERKGQTYSGLSNSKNNPQHESISKGSQDQNVILIHEINSTKIFVVQNDITQENVHAIGLFN